MLSPAKTHLTRPPGLASRSAIFWRSCMVDFHFAVGNIAGRFGRVARRNHNRRGKNRDFLVVIAGLSVISLSAKLLLGVYDTSETHYPAAALRTSGRPIEKRGPPEIKTGRPSACRVQAG